MPKRLGSFLFQLGKDRLIELCDKKGLNDLEKEIILRIYWQKQSINYISDTLLLFDFGKNRDYYSTRSINTLHKQAFLKLIT